MAVDTNSPRTRRALLGAGLGAVAATAASALTGSAVADAASAVQLGAANAETTPTTIQNTNAGVTAVALSGRLTHAASGPASAGLKGQDDGTGGTGVAGVADTGATARGVSGQSLAGRGVEGASSTGIGVYGHSASGRGVQGNSASGVGVQGQSNGNNGVFGRSAAPNASGVYGENTSASGGYGIAGRAMGTQSASVWGDSSVASAAGVYGTSDGAYAAAVWGAATGPSGFGLDGHARGQDGIGVYALQYGTATWAGYLNGDVHIAGTLSNPDPIIQMDHPGAPADRYYQQAMVGSFERISVIGGNAVTSADGRVTVKVPALFARYHADVRYQLTPLGPSQQLYVAQRLDAGGRFAIASDRPGLEVSWQLTGVRTDPAALKKPLRVDAGKPARYRGRYVQPALYGQPRSKSLVAPRPLPRIAGQAHHPKAR